MSTVKIICGERFGDARCGQEKFHSGFRNKHRGTGEFLGCSWTDAGKERVMAEQEAEVAAAKKEGRAARPHPESPVSKHRFVVEV